MIRTSVGRTAIAAVEAFRARALDLTTSVLQEPELGFRERRTAAKITDELQRLGYTCRTGIALTGVVAELDTGRAGPTVAVLAELDALPVPGHPHADPVTGAAHACGHHCQLGVLAGVARAVLDPVVGAALCGRVRLVAVPAEEPVDLDWRRAQRAAGRIEFLSGKAELIRLGEFDDVDLAMMIHTATADGWALATGEGTSGFTSKRAVFLGQAAHAGAAPERGVNALQAALLGIHAFDAQREAFRPEHLVRALPLVTAARTPNVIPDEATVECVIRAIEASALADVAARFDRSMRAGALALGARVDVETTPGYLPLREDRNLQSLFREVSATLVGEDRVVHRPVTGAVTDMGDLSHLIPCVHASTAGASGHGHGADYLIVDQEAAIVMPAKALALTVIRLLQDDGAVARRIMRTHRPLLDKERYLTHLRAQT